MVFSKVGRESNTLHIEYYETKLRKQGVLDLTVADHLDVEKIHDDDTIDFVGLHDCQPGDQVTLIIHHPDDSVEEVRTNCA